MSNYTKVEMRVYLKPEAKERFIALDEWLKISLIYNPELTPSYIRHGESDYYQLADGVEVPLPVYPGEDHPFFKNQNVVDLISLRHAEVNDEPIWCYDRDENVLDINAYFVNDYRVLEEFFDWLAPFVHAMGEAEYNYEGDLEGPRHICLTGDKITINRFSFTR